VVEDSVIAAETQDATATVLAIRPSESGTSRVESGGGDDDEAAPAEDGKPQESNFGLGIEERLRQLDLYQKTKEPDPDSPSSQGKPREAPRDWAVALDAFWQAMDEGWLAESDHAACPDGSAPAVPIGGEAALVHVATAVPSRTTRHTVASPKEFAPPAFDPGQAADALLLRRLDGTVGVSEASQKPPSRIPGFCDASLIPTPPAGPWLSLDCGRAWEDALLAAMAVAGLARTTERRRCQSEERGV
jgi:hypothetical protein